MIDLQEKLLRASLKPRVECDLPGRLRLSFSRYRLLPDAARPYLHYIEDVLKLLSGVREVEVNPRIGTILTLYDPQRSSARQILRWVDIVVDTGIEIARETDVSQGVDEAEMAERVRRLLVLRLPRARSEKK